MSNLLKFLLSFGIVAWGQPARMGWLGAVAAVCGYALFFFSLPSSASRFRKFLLGSLWFTAVQIVQLSWMTSMVFQGCYILFVYGLLALGIGCQFGLLTVVVSSGRAHLYPNRSETWNWTASKPRGSIDRKSLCISNTKELAIVEPRELSRESNSKFLTDWGIGSQLRLLCGAALWALIEWSRLFCMCGFSWNPIGLALTHCSFSLQYASLFGVFGLSFWVMWTNLAVLEALRRRTEKRLWVWALALASVPYLFGAVQFACQTPKAKRGHRSIPLALFQTRWLPSEKMAHPGRLEECVSPLVQWREIVSGLKAEGNAGWELIVLPEAAVPLSSDGMFFPFEVVRDILVAELGKEVEKAFPPLFPPFAQERIGNHRRALRVSNLFWCQTLSNYFKAELVIGLDHVDRVSKNNYNSLFFCRPHARSVDRYDKRVLLPLAEYLPFDFLSPFVENYGIVDFFTQGREARVLGEKNLFSPSICYEETFPAIMREGRVKGAKLFVNSTNDNYYPGSSLHEQHLYHARVRAVENGIPLVRSCNAGISAAIDCFGRIVARMEDPRNPSIYPKGVLNCRLSAYTFSTPYAFWGDGVIVGASMVICLLAGTLGLREKLSWI
jgi:apolipoprotein N-acyltransferase